MIQSLRLAVAALAVCLTACGSSSSSDDDSSDEDVVGTGTVSGGLVATVSKATVTAIGNFPGQADTFQISLAPTSDGMAVTTPAQSSLDGIVLEVLLGFTEVPTAGTYTESSATAGTQFGAIASWSVPSTSTSAQYSSGKVASGSPASPCSIKITSIEKTKATTSADLYAVHGSLDSTLNGAVVSTTGTSGQGEPIVVHFDF